MVKHLEKVAGREESRLDRYICNFAHKIMKLTLSVWVRTWRKHKVAQRKQRNCARKDLGMLKVYPRERRKPGKCICYHSRRISYGSAKSWRSLKSMEKKANRTWEQKHNLKVNSLNTAACAVRLESSVTCGQISAKYVHV